jgi:hypothetical protein
VLDHSGNLLVVDRSRSAWRRLIEAFFDAVRPKAPTPLPDCVFINPELARNRFALRAISASRDDLASLG